MPDQTLPAFAQSFVGGPRRALGETDAEFKARLTPSISAPDSAQLPPHFIQAGVFSGEHLKWVLDYAERYAREALRAQADGWREAIINALEVWNIYVPEIHDNSPRLALQALINVEVQAALDPAVSERARKLIDGAQAASEKPVFVVTVTKSGALVEMEPTTEAFNLPDGKYDLYAGAPPAQIPADVIGVEARPMATAPRDGSIIRLLVEFEDHSLEDDDKPQWTIGGNSLENTGEDLWQFAGWCWTHDVFTDGVGKPVGWLPLVDAPQPQAVAASSPAQAVKAHSYGGSTGINDYLMTDDSIKSMRPDEVVWAKSGEPAQAVDAVDEGAFLVEGVPLPARPPTEFTLFNRKEHVRTSAPGYSVHDLKAYAAHYGQAVRAALQASRQPVQQAVAEGAGPSDADRAHDLALCGELEEDLRIAAKLKATSWPPQGLADLATQVQVIRESKEYDWGSSKATMAFSEALDALIDVALATKEKRMSQQPNPTPMKIGGKYNWKNQPDRLIYLGRNWSGNGYWHQFKKIGDPRAVWCEVLDSDLHRIEETKEANNG